MTSSPRGQRYLPQGEPVPPTGIARRLEVGVAVCEMQQMSVIEPRGGVTRPTGRGAVRCGRVRGVPCELAGEALTSASPRGSAYRTPAPSHRDSLSFRVSSYTADQVAPCPISRSALAAKWSIRSIPVKPSWRLPRKRPTQKPFVYGEWVLNVDIVVVQKESGVSRGNHKQGSLPSPKHHSGLLDCARDASRGVCRKSVSGCHLSAHAVLVRHDSYLSYVFVGKLGLRCCCGDVSRSLCKRSSVRTLWDQVWSRREVQWQRTRSTPASKTMGARDPDGPDAPSLQPLSLVSF